MVSTIFFLRKPHLSFQFETTYSHQKPNLGVYTIIGSILKSQKYTFPAPEQFGHLWVEGAFKGRSARPDTEMGSMLKHTPLAEHRAHGKYPVYQIM